MKILVTAATQGEIELFAATVNTVIDTLVSGVGTGSTVYHLQKRLHQIDYDMVIQAGIAGSFVDNIKPGQTVLVKQDCWGDLGTEEKQIFQTVFEAGLTDANEFPFTNGWLLNEHKILDQSILPKVKAVTVNKISDSELQKQQIFQAFHPGIESMEGAALHYVCLMENIPFLQIRSISNYVGEREKSKWKMREALQQLNAELSILINLLTY